MFGRRGLGWKFKTTKLSSKLLPDHSNKTFLSFAIDKTENEDFKNESLIIYKKNKRYLIEGKFNDWLFRYFYI